MRTYCIADNSTQYSNDLYRNRNKKCVDICAPTLLYSRNLYNIVNQL